MSEIQLDLMDKKYIQKFFDNTQGLTANQLNIFKSQFAYGNQASWHRFIVGAYHHPLTWWIGIIQLQMQLGLWGHHQQSIATLRANLLLKVTIPLRKELADLSNGGNAPILTAIVKHNLQQHKSDMLGRLLGGSFTNYASILGRFGSKRLSKSTKRIRTITNFGLASYGAAIHAIITGHRSSSAVIQSILTGRPEQVPIDIETDKELTKQETEIVHLLEEGISKVFLYSKATLGPVPINEFCQRPENINTENLCR